MWTLVRWYIYSVHRYNIKAFKENTGEKITSCRECRRRRAPSSLLVAIVKYDGGADETSSESVNGGCDWGEGCREKGLEGNNRTVYCLYRRRPDGRAVFVTTCTPLFRRQQLTFFRLFVTTFLILINSKYYDIILINNYFYSCHDIKNAFDRR